MVMPPEVIQEQHTHRSGDGRSGRAPHDDGIAEVRGAPPRFDVLVPEDGGTPVEVQSVQASLGLLHE